MTTNGTLVTKVDRFLELKRQIDELDKERKELRNELMNMIGESGSVRDSVGRMIAVLVKTRKGLDTTRFKKDHPDLFEQYAKVTEYSQLEVSPSKLSSELVVDEEV